MKIIIEVRDHDTDGKRQDNTKLVKSIIKHANKWFNVESTSVKGKEK